LERSYISRVALYYLASSVTLTIFFEFWRLLTLLQLRERAASVPNGIIGQIFLVGARFDFAIACYIILPLMLLGMLPFVDVARNRPVRWLNNLLLFLLTAGAFLVQLVDIEFFRLFGARLNGMALEWKDTPGFVLGMVWQTYPVVRYLLLWAIIAFLFIKVILWLQKRLLLRRSAEPFWLHLIYLPILAAIFVIGARGRIEEKAPLTWGQAYFSEYGFANLLALNPNFTFARDAFYDARSKEQVAVTMSRVARSDAAATTRRLLGIPAGNDSLDTQRLHRRVIFDSLSDNPPNVILILGESLASVAINCLKSKFPYELSPSFDSLADEGVLFTNIYSAGAHTYTGIMGALYGYPAIPGGSIMKELVSQNAFWGLPSILRKKGYNTTFFCTHDPNFDNMQGFLMSNGMMRVYSLFDYSPTEKMSTLGVPDHVMFDHAVDIIKQRQGKRFFATLLTASNHGPWLVPEVPFIRVPETEKLAKELNAFKYADWALGRFIRMIENDPAFANTIIVITGDHGKLVNPTRDLDLSHYEAPILILDTNHRLPRGVRVNRLGSQTDLLATIMGLLRLDYDDYSFGKNLFDTLGANARVTDHALFSEEYMVGYMEGNYYLISRIGGKPSLYDLSTNSGDLADSLNAVVNDYGTKALSLFQSAYYNLQRPLNRSDTSGSASE
jgi:phosphoglycerol transferase MdoB-like AlkP superfamily enzyme